MRKFLLALGMFGMAISIAGCATKPIETAKPEATSGVETPAEEIAPEASTKAESDWKIAVVPKDSTNAWFVRMEVGVKRYAQDSGLNVFQKGPAKTDAAMQVQVIQDLIAQGVDALCVVPVDPAALEPVLAEALENDIVVVTHEASFQENTMYNIEAFDNSNYGGFIMDNLAKAMGEEGIYTTMVAHVTNASHNEWADGGVKQANEKYPNLKLLEAEARVESEDNTERAYEKAKELFKKYPDLKGIMGTSSKDAPGVARAIEELGLKDKVFTAGTGLVSECGKFLENGTLQATTLWDPADAGYVMASLATKILRGEKIENGINLGLPGYESMQFVPGTKTMVGNGWIVITKENMKDYDF